MEILTKFIKFLILTQDSLTMTDLHKARIILASCLFLIACGDSTSDTKSKNIESQNSVKQDVLKAYVATRLPIYERVKTYYQYKFAESKR